MEEKNKNVASLSCEFVKAQIGSFNSHTKTFEHEPWMINELRFLYGVVSMIDPTDNDLKKKVEKIRLLQQEIRDIYMEKSDNSPQERENLIRNIKTQIINLPKEPIVISKKEYLSFIKATKSNKKRSTLYNLAHRMNSKVIDIDKSLKGYSDDGFTFTSIFHDTSYSKDAEELTVYISNAIYPHIVDLKRFAKLAIQKTITIPHTKTARLYTLCRLNYFNLNKKGEKKFEIGLDELHSMICKPNTYTEYKSFSQFVLSIAVESINKNKQLEFTVNVKPKRIHSRKVNIIEFTLISRNKVYENDADQLGKTNDKLIIALKDEFSLSETDLIKLENDFGLDKMQEKYDYYIYCNNNEENKKIKKPTAWYISALTKNYNTADMKAANKVEEVDPQEEKIKELKSKYQELRIKISNAIEDIKSPVAQYSESIREKYEKDLERYKKEILEVKNKLNKMEVTV